MNQILRRQQDMTEEELQHFTQKSVQQQQEQEELSEHRRLVLGMNTNQLREQCGVVREEKEQSADIPEQKVDEKESRRARREQKSFKKQVQRSQADGQSIKPQLRERRAGMLQAGKPDSQAEEMFTQTLRAEMFTLKYVQENYAELRKTLDSWREHLLLFEGEAEKECLTEDKKLRLAYMETMYVQGEEALREALLALGYRCVGEANKRKMVSVSLSRKQRSKAVERNAAFRTRLAENKDPDERVADDILKIARQKGEERYQAFRARYNTVASAHLSAPEQYEKLQEIEQLMQRHTTDDPVRREGVEKLAGELRRLMEAIGEAHAYGESFSTLEEKEKYLGLEKVRKSLHASLIERQKAQEVLWKKVGAVEAGIKYLLQVDGVSLTSEQFLLLEDFMPQQLDVYRQLKEQTKQQVISLMDARRERERDEQGMRNVWGREDEIEDEFRHYVERVDALDFEALRIFSEVDHAKAMELQELAVTGEKMSKARKKFPSLDRMLPDVAAFQLKCGRVRAFAMCIRAFQMLNAYGLGVLDEDCFFREELAEYQQEGMQGAEAFTEDRLLLIAKEMMEKGLAAHDAVVKKYESEDMPQQINSHADEKTYAIYEACWTAFSRVPEYDIRVLAQHLSQWRLTEEMLKPEYMIEHMEEIICFVCEVNLYQNAVAMNPTLENLIPQEQKVSWQRKEDVYRKYYFYLLKFARSQGVDILNGSYLRQWEYESERESTQEWLARDKETLYELMGGFGNYADRLQQMQEAIDSVENLKKAQRASLKASLQELSGKVKGLIDYLSQPFARQDAEGRQECFLEVKQMLAGVKGDVDTLKARMEKLFVKNGEEEDWEEDSEEPDPIELILSKLQEMSEGFEENQEKQREARALMEQCPDDISYALRKMLKGTPRGIQDVRADVEEGIQWAVRSYTGDTYYRNINNYLRGIEELDSSSLVVLNTLRSILKRAELPERMTLYRGMHRTALSKLLHSYPNVQELVGKTIEEPAFMSTSSELGVAQHFAQDGVILVIQAPKGARAVDISALSEYDDESEYLFDVGQEMLITQAEENAADGRLYLYTMLM